MSWVSGELMQQDGKKTLTYPKAPAPDPIGAKIGFPDPPLSAAAFIIKSLVA